MTVQEALAEAGERLARAGIGTPELDAELLLRHVLGWSRADVVTRAGHALSAEVRGRYLALVAERATRRPVQHLTGRQAFWRHEFEVTPDVLVPRPETELLVEAALAVVPPDTAPRVVDVGTGSGCIALSIAAERPRARVAGTDVSPAALRVAARNRSRLGLAGRVPLVRADLLAPFAEGSLDVVVSNPPYVERDEPLEPEVRDHDPHLALFPPRGAAELFSRLAAQAARALRPGGHLLVEVGRGQAESVRAIGRAAALAHAGTTSDLRSIPRVVALQRITL